MRRSITRRYRIVSRTRFTVSVTVLLLVTVLAASTVFCLAGESAAKTASYCEVNIVQGDTLWDIAAEYGPDKCDIRKVIHAICDVNDIRPEDLRPGQVIKVPMQI